MLELRVESAPSFSMYRSSNDLMIRGSGSEVTTVKNFTTTGYIESLEYKTTSSGVTNFYTLSKVGNGTSGRDWVAGTLGNDTLNGAAGNDVLQGDKGDDILYGGSGNDVLNGGFGNDILNGGEGNDIFVFTSTPNNSLNVDTINDFKQGEDLIRIKSSVFSQIGNPGLLKNTAFWSGSGVNQAHDSDDRIIYDTTSGKLYYDADGIGSSTVIQIALIGTTTHADLKYTDFLIN